MDKTGSCADFDSPSWEMEAINLAIAESLATENTFTCEWCKQQFEDMNGLQSHQVDQCPGIENPVGNDSADEDQFHDVPSNFVVEPAIEKTKAKPPLLTTQPISIVEPSCSSTASTIVELPSVKIDYTLNKASALHKKLDSCDNRVVLTFNTAAFELFRVTVLSYLRSKESEYVATHTPRTDQQNNITEETIRVVDKTVECPMFTINLYRTTSRAMINGPKHTLFVNEGLNLVLKNIDQNNVPLHHMNSELKHQILEAHEQTIKHSPMTNRKSRRKSTTTAKLPGSSSRKYYPTRRCTLIEQKFGPKTMRAASNIASSPKVNKSLEMKPTHDHPKQEESKAEKISLTMQQQKLVEDEPTNNLTNEDLRKVAKFIVVESIRWTHLQISAHAKETNPNTLPLRGSNTATNDTCDIVHERSSEQLLEDNHLTPTEETKSHVDKMSGEDSLGKRDPCIEMADNGRSSRPTREKRLPPKL